MQRKHHRINCILFLLAFLINLKQNCDLFRKNVIYSVKVSIFNLKPSTQIKYYGINCIMFLTDCSDECFRQSCMNALDKAAIYSVFFFFFYNDSDQFLISRDSIYIYYRRYIYTTVIGRAKVFYIAITLQSIDHILQYLPYIYKVSARTLQKGAYIAISFKIKAP